MITDVRMGEHSGIDLLAEYNTQSETTWTNEADRIIQSSIALKDYWTAFTTAGRRAVEEFKSFGTQVVEWGEQVAKELMQAFSDTFFDAIRGNLKNAEDIWWHFFKSLGRMFSDFLAQKATQT